MTNYVKTERKIKIESKEDRLSELPKDIIIDIISLLPLRCAVATSVLSRRWHNLWTQIHSIDVRYSEFNSTPLRVRYNFFNIIDTVLEKLTTSTTIQRFTFSLGHHYCYERDLWFDQICCRNVKEINADTSVSPLVLPRPTLVFQTMSLVELHIGDGFWLPFPSSDNWVVNFNLPRLKKLRLPLFRGHAKILERLVSSCPLLEEFFVKVFHSGYILHDIVFNLSCHDLKILELEVINSQIKRYPVYTTKFVIDVPKLKYFGVCAKSYEDISVNFVENPTALLKVRLSKEDRRLKEIVGASSNFCKTISHVTSLELDCIRFKPSIAFHNLTHLKLRWPLGNDWKVLIRFLRCCPALEVLMLNIVSLYQVKNLRWKPLETPKPPACLQTRLKKIELKNEKSIGYKEQLINMVRYLLQNFRVLEQFTFRIDKRDDGKIKDKSHIQSNEWKVCEEMFSLPKRSSRCQINFVGECHKASSNNNARRIVQGS